MIAWLLMLAVSAGLSMNLVLQLGVGIREIALAGKSETDGNARGFSRRLPIRLSLRLGVFFASALLLWLLFSFVRSLLPLGFLEYVLVFPVSVMVSSGWEHVFGRHLPDEFGSDGGGGRADVFTGGAPIAATLFVTLTLAGGFVEALVLSMGFMFGTLLAVVVVAEIRRRARMEAVPRWLRGAPLSIVAMGILSLVFSFAAIMFFDVLG